MKHTAKWIPLNTVINHYISDAQLTSAAFLRLWHLAVRCLEQLNMMGMGEPKTRKLEVNGNKTVDLPEDYVQWIKVGVQNADGEIATLRRNTDLSRYAAIENDRTSVNTGEIGYALLNEENYRNYFSENRYLTLLGAQSGTAVLGQFDVDDTQGVILLDNNYGYSYVILEYLASPSVSEDFLIPVQWQEAVIAWLAWNDIKNAPASRRKNIGEVAARKKEYYNQRNRAIRLTNPFRVPEANDIIRLGQKLAVKA